MRLASLSLFFASAVTSFACTDLDSATTDDTDNGKADGSSVHVPWSVTRHIWPPGVEGDSQALFQQDADLIAGLGAKAIRSDVWWYVIEPQPGVYNEAALAYYRWVVTEAKARGLDMILILSNPPKWANNMLDEGKVAAVADSFAKYSARVADTVGLGDVIYYQLWNEPNHIEHTPFDTDIALINAARRGLTEGLTRAGFGDLPIRTVVNVMIDGHDLGVGPNWQSDLEYLMDHGARDAVDIVAIDHYPGTFDPRGWDFNFLDRLFDTGEKYGKAVSIQETGYSTARCVPPFHTEAGQADWVRGELPKIRAKVNALSANHDVKFEIANFFRLDDRQSSNCFNVEDFFGVVRKDRSLKPAYQALKEEIAKF
jgi:hypothetical protein